MKVKIDLKLAYVLLLLSCCCLLNACQSIQSTYTANKRIEEQKERAAKINVRLAMAYLERKDILRAKHKFLLALEEAPQLPETAYAMGYFLEQTGDDKGADLYYLKAIKLDPKRGDALNNYGTFLCRKKHYHESIAYFLKATQDPNYLATAAAYENAGLCAKKIPDLHEAQKYFKKALSVDSLRTTSLINLAQINYEHKNYALVKEQLEQFKRISVPTEKSLQLEAALDRHFLMYG